MFDKVKNVHLVGIGGIGMCGIAELLLHWGFKISGSDLHYSKNIKRLTNMGAKVTIGHKRENVNNCDILAYSSAVKPDNPELLAAIEKKIPIIRRAEMLGEIIKLRPTSIAVGGTHGKTTTTSMVGEIFSEANRDPIIIVGGVVKSTGSTTQPGKGDVIIVEADEFDRSFLKLAPTYSVITTIEAEHLDCYKNLDEIENAFIQFGNSVPDYGAVIACIDEPSIGNILPNLNRKVITYGITSRASIQGESVSLSGLGSSFSVKAFENKLGEIQLSVPGFHNVKNALAAIALGLEFDINFENIAIALKKFSGVHRRFEITLEQDDLILIDDYAHHPTEIKATLEAAKKGWNRRLVAIFQPHLFTRTRDFFKEFGEALLAANVIIVLDIYPAREERIEGISGKLIADAAKNFRHKEVYYVENRNILTNLIQSLKKPGDIIITMGAGDVWKINKKLKELLKHK